MEQKKEDIFDRMMHLHLFRIFEPFYQKNKEMLLYLLFGGLTTIVSIGSYAWVNVGLGINELIANIISWIFAVTFAYVTNKIWVFQSKITGFFRCLPGNDKILRWSPVYTWCRRIASVSFYYLASWKQCTCKICSTDCDSGVELYY